MLLHRLASPLLFAVLLSGCVAEDPGWIEGDRGYVDRADAARISAGPGHDGGSHTFDPSNVHVTRSPLFGPDYGQGGIDVPADPIEGGVPLTEDDVQASCAAALSVAADLPSGRSLVACGDRSWIAPDHPLNTDEDFEIRVTARPDDRFDGTYLSLASTDERLELDRSRDTVVLTYTAFVRDDAGYGQGELLSGTLVAPLARSAGSPVSQEVRVGASAEGLALYVDGVAYGSVPYGLDFAGLVDGGVVVGATPLAAFDSIGFYPGAPAAGAIWSDPCDDAHAKRGSWCVDFDGVAVDELGDGDMVAEPTGIFMVDGEFQLFGG
jgi:hypothetical protein